MAIVDAPAAIHWLDTELPNLAAAVHQASAEAHPASWLLADALCGYSWMRKLAVDWSALGNAALTAARTAGKPDAEAAVQNLLGNVALQHGGHNVAIAHFERLLTLADAADWPEAAATAHTNLSVATRFTGQLRRSATHLERAMGIDRRNGLPDGHPVVLGILGNVLRDLGRLSESLECLQRAEHLRPDLDSQHNRMHRQANLGRTRYLLGDRERAAVHWDCALAMARESRDLGSEAYVLRLQASDHRDTGDLPAPWS
ncbi:hypothetical protein [Streptomyces sp. 1222.5]|uniref:hypothetical protein n=1 Tax=Streptomyces sp. 1222.5 TaxID=1881026 RepID=UPI003D711885